MISIATIVVHVYCISISTICNNSVIINIINKLTASM